MVCKCGIMRPQNESARLPGARPAAPLPPGLSLSRGWGAAAGEEAGLPEGEGAWGAPCQSSQLTPHTPTLSWGSWPGRKGPGAGRGGDEQDGEWEGPRGWAGGDEQRR